MDYRENEVDTEKIYEDYIQALLTILDKFDNITFILSNDMALDLVTKIEELGYKFNEEDEFSFKAFEELYNEDVLMISKYKYEGKYTYILESAYGYEHLKSIQEGETDIVFVEDGVISKEEIKQYIDCDVVSLFESEEDCFDDEDDDLDELFEELTEEVLDDIMENQDEFDFCLHCTIKDIIQEAYELGFGDGINSTLE